MSRYAVAADGLYYLKVGRYYNSTAAGGYELRVQVARGVQQESDANYGNDSTGTANALSLAVDGNRRLATVQGTVMGPQGGNTDEDVYALGVYNTGNVVELGLRLPSGGSLQPKVTLLDASGAAVADQDGDPSDGHVRATLAADGQYYARVEGYWTHDGHTYLPTATAGYWTNAEAQAQALGGHLVTVDAAAEQAWLTANFGPMANVWIGASDAAVEGTYRWADGGAVGYANWASGQPYASDSRYDYAYMGADGRWSSYPNDWANWYGIAELPLAGAAGGDKRPGPDAQYLLDVSIADLVPPRVSAVSGLPAAGSAAAVPAGPTFTVTLSEALDAATVAAATRPVWQHGGHFYTLTEGGGSWTAREAEAQALGGHLATVNDAGEQDFLRRTFERLGTNLWIGLNDAAVEGTYRWADGSVLGYSNWGVSQPNTNNGAYDYAYMGPDGRWYVREDGYGSLRGIIELTGADADGDGIPDVLDPHAADPLNAWDLREAGADGVFGSADDVRRQVTLAAAYAGGTTVQLQAEGGSLGAGQWRFTANATLKDPAGNFLDGDADGAGGDAYRREFGIAVPAGFVFEGGNNDTLYTATVLPLAEDPAGGGLWLGRGIGRQDPAVSGNYYSDPDWWQVELRAGDWLTVAVDTPDSAVDPYLEVVNAAGGGLASDENGGPDSDALVSRYAVAADGLYYLKVGKNYSSTAAGGYELRVQVARGVQQESDANYSNDIVSSANPISLQTIDDHRVGTIQGTLMTPQGDNTDEDFFSLGIATVGETVFLSVKTPDGSPLRPVLEIWDSANALALVKTNPTSSVLRYDVTSTKAFYARVLATAGRGSEGQYLLDAAIWPTGTIEFADLAVFSVSGPTAAASGETVHFDWTVGNYGTGSTDRNTWVDRIVLSSNENYGDGDDIEVAAVTHTGQLAPEQTYNGSADVRLPLGISGTYRLFVETDRSRQVYEYLFEGNNYGQALTNVTITETPAADLQIDPITAPALGVAGQPINLSWTVRNNGTGTTGDGTPNNQIGSWTDRLVLSTDTVLGNADDRLIADVSHIGTLEAGESYLGSYNGMLPSGVSGSYYLLIASDNGNSVYEGVGKEVNSVSSSTTITVAPAAYADLRVSDFSGPSSIRAGAPANLQWTVENTANAWGATPVNAWSDRVVLSQDAVYGNGDDIHLGTFSHNAALDKTANYQANPTVTLPGNLSGAYFLFVATDSASQVYEFTHEGNNVSVAVPVTIHNADLTVSTVNTSANGVFGTNLDLSWTAKNQGDEPTWQNWQDGVWLSRDAVFGGDDIRLATVQANATPLAVNGEYSRTASAALPIRADFATGDYYLLVRADEYNNQGESNENNNVGVSGLIHLTRPQYDLQVRNLTVEPTALRSGGSVTLHWDDYNDGVDPLAGSFHDRIYIRNTTTGETLLDTTAYYNNTLISAGLGVARTYSFTLPNGTRGAGSLDIQVISDYHNTIVETNGTGDAETNNTAQISRNATLAAYPDMAVGGISSLTQAQVGQRVNVDWTATNLGDADAAGPWTERIYLSADSVIGGDDQLIRTISFPGPMAVGGTLARTAGIDIPSGISGNRYIVVGISSDNGTYDRDTANNIGIATQAINILAPDLSVSDISASSTAQTGQQTLISWTVANTGNTAAQGSWVDRVLLSQDAVLGNDTVLTTVAHNGSVAVGGTYSQTKTVTLPALTGQYYLLVATDVYQTLSEASDNNNLSATDTAMVITTPYSTTVQTNINYAPNGTPIPLFGHAAKTSDGTPAAGQPVTIRILTNTTRRVLTATTDANGDWQTTFVPLQFEAGQYRVAADHPAVATDTVQDQFVLVGMDVSPARPNLQLVPGLPVSGKVVLHNLSDVPLTGLAVTAQGLPANLGGEASLPDVLPGNGSVELAYTFTATDASLRQGTVSLQVTTAEGASLNVPVTINIVPLVSQLTSNPGYLKAGMVRGQQTTLSFEISNGGGAPSGELKILLPDFPWLSLAQEATIPSINPGQKAQVTLVATPSADLPLGRYTGSIAVQGKDGSLSQGFEFTVTSAAVGDLQVAVVDDYTYYVDGAPKVEGAKVILRDPFDNSIIVAEGLTNASGMVLLPGVHEGSYLLEVTADKHGTSRITYVVQSGITNEAQIFIGRETITYSWKVVPTKIQDVYTIKLESSYETNVPVPLVIIEMQDNIPYLVPGRSTQIDVILTNHGLINAENVELQMPQHSEFMFTSLVTKIGVLPANTSITIPMTVTRKGLESSQESLISIPSSLDSSDWNSNYAINQSADNISNFVFYDVTEDVSVKAIGNFDTSRPSTIITHGWNGSSGDAWIVDLALAIHTKDRDRNILVVNWSEGADFDFIPYWPASNINIVGEEVANKLNTFYQAHGAPITSETELDFIGHSFGCYVSNVAAMKLGKDLNGKANSLVALDQANPLGLWYLNSPNVNFQDHFKSSIAYHSGDLAGSCETKADFDFWLETPYESELIDKWAKEHHYAIEFLVSQTLNDDFFAYGKQPQVQQAEGFEGFIDLDGNFHSHSECKVWVSVVYEYLCGTSQVTRQDNSDIDVGLNVCCDIDFPAKAPTTGMWKDKFDGSYYLPDWLVLDFQFNLPDISQNFCDPCIIELAGAVGGCVWEFAPIPSINVVNTISNSLETFTEARNHNTGSAFYQAFKTVISFLGEIPVELPIIKQLIDLYECGNGFYGDLIGTCWDQSQQQDIGKQSVPDSYAEAFPLLDAYRNEIANVGTFIDAFVGNFGSDVWLLTKDGQTLTDWLDAFQSRIEIDSGDGEWISSTERGELLSSALPVSATETGLFLDRWNRSLDYWQVGIFNLTDVPSGQSTDFIAIDRRLAELEAANAVIEADRIAGFSNPIAAVVDAKNDILDWIDGQSGVCAKVKIEIDQKAVMTRNAFLGTLEIVNGSTAGSIEGVRVELDIRDENGNLANDKFGISAPELSGLTGVDGTGAIVAGGTGTAKYTFIPNREAAPTTPTIYRIGGTLRYISPESGQEVTMPLLHSTITVYPDALLQLDYFQQRDVIGDDPFTDQIEPSEPFTLGLLVHNVGAGMAESLTITSAQPKIIENEKGLLIDFQIVGTQVGSQTVTPSLTADLGNIDPGQVKEARWLLTSTLQGRFIDYSATFEHVTGLGDPRLSLIDSVNIHELIHTVRADRVGDDALYDFLANDEADPNVLPDRLYLSDGSVAVVNVGEATIDHAATLANRQVQLTANMASGWSYVRLPDPGEDLKLSRVIRSDGKEIRVGDNAWQTDWVFAETNQAYHKESRLHLLDYDSTGSYTLIYVADDTVAPYLTEITPVAPNPQTGPVSFIDVTFSEEVDLSTFDFNDVTLTRNGGTNLAGSSVTVSHVSGTTYRIGNLTLLTGGDGNYQLTVDAKSVNDYGLNAGTNTLSTAWAKGIENPTVVSVGPVAPDVRHTTVSSLDVLFSKPINASSFDLGDISLTRDGSANLINAGVSIVSIGANSFRVNGLDSITANEGRYALTVDGSGVQDVDGNTGVGYLSGSWTMDTTTPTFTGIEQLATNPRNIVVMSLDVDFSEAINASSFDWSDITLTRNGGANLITNAVTVRQVDANTFSIEGFNWVVGQNGHYILGVNGAGVTDLAGNAIVGSVSTDWVMDTVDPLIPANLAIVPDNGVSIGDGLTNALAIRLMGDLSETGLAVSLTDMTTIQELGYATVNGTAFDANFTLSGPGQHRLRVRVTDAAGNLAPDSFFDVFVDQIAPSVASIASVTPDTRTSPVESIDVTLNEPVDLAGFTYQDLTLTRDGEPVTLDGTVSVAYISGNTYRVSGLSGLTEANGSYQFTLSATGLMDQAGNVGTGSNSIRWTKQSGLTSSIQGFLYEDIDGNGSFNYASYNPEAGIAGRTVFLDTDTDGRLDAGETFTTSGEGGNYAFAGLAAGNYRVTQVLPEGWMLTSPVAGVHEVTLTEGQTVMGRDFGNFQMGVINGIKFNDLDADGMREAGESPLAGWTIFLDTNHDGTLDEGEARVVTGDDGAFSFTGIIPGTVELGEVAQQGWRRTTPNTTYRIKSGFNLATDMGNVQLGSLSGVKFNDLDGDGIRDTGEPGIEGWTVFLDANANGTLDTGEASALTAANGTYAFTGLLPGQYIVAEAHRTGWIQTTPLPTAAGVGIGTSSSNIVMESLGCPCGGSWSTSPSAPVDYAALAINSALDTVGISGLRSQPGYANLDGRGVSTVVIDTGIDLNHSFFGPDSNQDGIADRIIYQYDFANNDANASDVNGHGSHIASLIGSQNTLYKGVAHATDLIALKVFEDSGRGYFSYLENALQWVVANRETYHIGVVNLSLGDSGNWTDDFSRYGIGDELAALSQTDVIVIAAAGNNYYQFGRMGVAYPASDPAAIAVGSTWAGDFGGPWRIYTGASSFATGIDQINAFSQRDSTLLDTFAPGARFNGADANGGIKTMQGTSQAAAFVSGTAVLAQQIAHETLGRGLTTGEFAQLLRSTGDLITDGDDEVDNVVNTGLQFPRLNFEKLAARIATLDTEPPGDGSTGGDGGGSTHLEQLAASGVHNVTLSAGAELNGLDFGNFRLGEIGGVVYNDLDGNGQQGTGETGLQGRTVFLDADNNGSLDTGESSQLTNAQGAYRFTDLGPATYRVRTVQPQGWAGTAPAGGMAEVAMTSGLVAANLDFGSNNLPPVAQGDAYSVDEDRLLTVNAPGVLGNDNDPGNDALSANLVTGTAHGVLSFNTDGSFSYQPDHDYFGADSFTYRAYDGQAYSEITTVSLTVDPANDAPTLSGPVSLSVIDEDGAGLDFSQAQLLATASDIDGNALSVAGLALSNASQGVLTDLGGGNWHFALAANLNGQVSLTYRVIDGNGGETPATATLTVNPVNDKPTADPVANRNVAEGQAVELAVTGHDVDGDTLHYALLQGPVGASIDPDSGAFRWAAADGPTTHAVGVRVSDNHVNSFFDLFLEINVANVVPTLTATGNATALGGTAYQLNLGANDPGADTIDHWTVNWGDGQTETLDGNPGTASHVYGRTGGAFTIQASATDEDGTYSADPINLAVAANPLSVTSLTPTATGFKVRFDTAFDPSAINLYDAADTPKGPADVVLSVGGAALRGSLVMDADLAGFTFIKTGGLLAAGNYSLTLRSGADGFHDVIGGLDGDDKGVAGGNYLGSFNVAATGATVVSVADFMRGPGQPVNLPANGAGLPILLNSTGNVNTISFTLDYDPAKLSVTGAELAAGLPAGTGLTATQTSTGQWSFTVTAPSNFAPGKLSLIKLIAEVPVGAAYGGGEVLDIGNVVVNNGGITALDDDGLHLVGYFGDTTGNGAYDNPGDSQLAQRVASKLDSGFTAYPNTDPVVIADINGDGALSSVDASRLKNRSMGRTDPAIPALPSIGPLSAELAPKVWVDAPQTTTAGQTFAAAVKIDDARNLGAVKLTLAYDADALQVLSIRRGGVTGDFAWFADNSRPGTIDIDMARYEPMPGGVGDLLVVEFRVKDTASGTVRLDLAEAKLNQGKLALNIQPQPGVDMNDADVRIQAIPQQTGTMTLAAFGLDTFGDDNQGLPIIDMNGLWGLDGDPGPLDSTTLAAKKRLAQTSGNAWQSHFVAGRTTALQSNPNASIRLEL